MAEEGVPPEDSKPTRYSNFIKGLSGDGRKYWSPQGITVQVLQAKGLAKMDMMGKADPYVVVRCGGLEPQRTDVVKDSLTPMWGSTFGFHGVDGNPNDKWTPSQITAQVYDWDRGVSDDPMGQVLVPLEKIDGKAYWYKLKEFEGCEDPKGSLELRCYPALSMSHSVEMGAQSLDGLTEAYTKEEVVAAAEAKLGVTIARGMHVTENAFEPFTGFRMHLTDFDVVHRNKTNTLMQIAVRVDAPEFDYCSEGYIESVPVFGKWEKVYYVTIGYVSATQRVMRMCNNPTGNFEKHGLGEVILMTVDTETTKPGSSLTYTYKSEDKGEFKVTVVPVAGAHMDADEAVLADHDKHDAAAGCGRARARTGDLGGLAAAATAAAPGASKRLTGPAAELSMTLFDLLDIDQSKALEPDEVRAYLLLSGCEELELEYYLKDALRVADTDKNGTLVGHMII